MDSFLLFFVKRLLRFIKGRAKYKNAVISRKRFETAVSLVPFRFPGFTYQPFLITDMKCEWVIPGSADNKKVLLFFHGGGYGAGSINTHRGLACALANESGVKVLLIEYRLAPENKYPAALEDAVAAYQWLLKEGYSADKIAFGGDSAGGGLTICTALYLRDNHLPLPKCIIALSPWLDLSQSGDSVTANKSIDPVLVYDGLFIWSKNYLGDADSKAPYASPLFQDLKGLPPIYIQVGEDEMLLSDSVRFAEKARAADVNVELDVFPAMFHVFNAYWQVLPQSKAANKKLGVFLRLELGT
jgi:acetyl esterase/lipase